MNANPIPSPFRAEMTLEEARETLRPLAVDGTQCPCCTQLVKIYERTIHSTMATGLVLMWNTARGDWVHVPTVLDTRAALAGRLGGGVAKLRYWGLVEEEEDKHRPDGGRAGYWRVTEQGREWLDGHVTVPKYARVYDGRCLGLHGDAVAFSDVLPEGFDLQGLMATAGDVPAGEQSALFDVQDKAA